MQVVVMGVSGCGKSTIGRALATKINANFIDGDDLHPKSNIEKMSKGIPLDDFDRKPWLIDVGKALTSGENVVIACSALKRSYRDLIRQYAPKAIFLHLTGSRILLESRMNQRGGHFMKTKMLESQLATLEALQPDEIGGDFDVANSPEQIIESFLSQFNGES